MDWIRQTMGAEMGGLTASRLGFTGAGTGKTSILELLRTSESTRTIAPRRCARSKAKQPNSTCPLSDPFSASSSAFCRLHLRRLLARTNLVSPFPSVQRRRTRLGGLPQSRLLDSTPSRRLLNHLQPLRHALPNQYTHSRDWRYYWVLSALRFPRSVSSATSFGVEALI